ncbi:E3 ubiquitin-protein ligase RGLG2-like [Papaver somniferum]|uniref:E3 ubiquitin-protein ligase RGLG2-like n=1 Tax=Papaver somniferum TaxID=3469 RepID=UPI000E6F543F|nr:E3 ubiquitin-protein ligase RGLG2-like [Papaver somniferum]
MTKYKSLEQVAELLAPDLATSSLIVGIDFSISNTCHHSLNGRSLHQIGDAQNPYEQVLRLTEKTLAPCMKDKLVHCFGFGDASTQDQDVFSFREDKLPCNGLLEVLTRYRAIASNLKLAGPTSYVAIVEMAMAIVGKSGGKHHVLLIIGDSQVTRYSGTDSDKLGWFEQKTVDAIAQAREYSLSIILVGDEPPPSMMFSFRQISSLRAYDNFKFVNFTGIMSKDVHLSRKEIEFALAAFMEISKHKNTCKRKLGFLYKEVGSERVPLLPPVHNSAPILSKSFFSDILRRENTIHDESGPWFDRLEHESPMIGGYTGVIHIGNFPVPSSFEALYKKIWLKHGHLATRNIIKTSTLTLATIVAELLKSIAAMESVKRDKLSASLLGKWDRQIEDTEALQFNVQWLRRHFEMVKKSWEAASLLRNSQLT